LLKTLQHPVFALVTGFESCFSDPQEVQDSLAQYLYLEKVQGCLEADCSPQRCRQIVSGHFFWDVCVFWCLALKAKNSCKCLLCLLKGVVDRLDSNSRTEVIQRKWVLGVSQLLSDADSERKAEKYMFSLVASANSVWL
jgi:hypothetical protein